MCQGPVVSIVFILIIALLLGTVRAAIATPRSFAPFWLRPVHNTTLNNALRCVVFVSTLVETQHDARIDSDPILASSCIAFLRLVIKDPRLWVINLCVSQINATQCLASLCEPALRYDWRLAIAGYPNQWFKWAYFIFPMIKHFQFSDFRFTQFLFRYFQSSRCHIVHASCC